MIVINNISKKYRKGSKEFVALDNVSFKIEKGDYVAVNGASGAGKSTLLYAIGGLIHPDSGEILYDGKNIYNMSGKDRDKHRKKHVGFVFQQFHLMPYLSVYENIKLACFRKEHVDRIDYFIGKCSLGDMKNKLPEALSVGEKQRTAFIRAIVSDPQILLADEPTGNLDPLNSNIMTSLVKDFNSNGGTVIIVTHNTSIAEYANRRYSLNSGRLVSE